LGFLGATTETASRVYDVLDFDVLIRSQRTRRLGETLPFPQIRLDEAGSVAGVRRVCPLWVGFCRWRIPRGEHAGYGRPILVMGVKPGDPVFRVPEMQAKAALLTEPEFVLIDRLSRNEFGPVDGKSFGDADLGGESELGSHRIRLVGHYALGASFDSDGSLVTSDEGFTRALPGWSSDMVGMGLVQLDGPHVDADDVAARLNSILPPDVEAFSRAGIIAHDRRMWLWDMSIGLIFVTGVGVGWAVGVVIVYQILSSDVLAHLPEYATLMAIGYRSQFLNRVVLVQAVLVALLGFFPGLLVTLGLYRLTTLATNIPLSMTWFRVLTVLILTVGMCAVSGLAALRKLRGADPADLY
jgi:putative ABC transport system permease protein